MKLILTLLDKIKACFIQLVSGWYSVEIFGTPKDSMGTYMVCLKNNSVMEFNYSNFNGDVRWYKIGIGDEHECNPIIYWKPLPKAPYSYCQHK